MPKFYHVFYISCLCGALVLLTEVCQAQMMPDTLQMPQVEVVATRIHQPQKFQPVHINIIDSARLALSINKDIGQLLSMNSGLFIKSEGPGALADASQGGLSPEQIQVLWEGIPLNHAMLGLTDLSLLPTSFFSSIQTSAGVPSSSFGGGLSGGIYLNSDFQKSNRVSISQSAGSFGRYHSGLNASAYQNHWRVTLHSQYINDENNYKYFNRATQQVERRQHNHQVQKNIMASAGYGKGHNKLKTIIWYTNSDNDLPGNILVSHNQARQDDNALRWLSLYHTSIGKLQVTAKNYLGRVALNYFKPSKSIESYSISRRWIGSANFQYLLSQQVKIKGEIRGGITGVETNNYADLKTRKHFSILINPDIFLFNRRLKLYPALRFNSFNDFGNVLSPSLGLNFALVRDRLYLRGQVSRNFNPPTFNALYWIPTGNPNLKPERSKNASAGIAATLGRGLFHNISLSGFYYRVHNGIRWLPNADGVSTPRSIQEISSKGMKLNIVSNFHPGADFNLKFRQTGLWLRTEIAKPRFPGDLGVGNQMRYVPEWRYKASLSIQKSFLTALIHYRWVSRRYVTEIESIKHSLDPYQRVDVALQAHRQWLGLTFTGNLQINNLLNADYAIIRWYVMPRRNVQFTSTVTYNF